MRRIKLLLFLVLSVSGYAQNIDSLWKVYNNKNQTDSNRLTAIHTIAWSLRSNDPDTAIIWAKQEIQFITGIPAEKRKFWTAKAYSVLGMSFLSKGDFKKALDYFFKTLQLYEELKNKKAIGVSYGYISNAYYQQSNYPKALEYAFKSLKIVEETIDDKTGMEKCYNQIGNIYLNLADYPRALTYYVKSLSLCEKTDDKQSIGACYVNMGIVYDEQANYALALAYYLKGLKMLEEVDDKQSMGACYINISDVYANQLNYTKSLEYIFKSLQLRKEIGDRQGIGSCFGNLGDIYNVLNKNKLALQYCDSALQISKELGDINGECLAYENLADIYAKTKLYKEAYEYHVKFKTVTDSIFNADNSKQLGDIKTRFEVEKKESELKAKAEAQQAISIEEKKRQSLVLVLVSCVLMLVIIFSALLYKRFRITNKQKQIIEIKSKETEEQKHLVEEKQKEIIDSITYAKRLQQAILPADAEIRRYLPDYFMYYQPKDIVAGDFYWMEHLEGISYLAAADSTGHGVPGAMVSVVCSNALNRAVKEFGLRDTGKILDKTRELVLETFEKSGEEIKDGMDISLLRIKDRVPGGTTEIQWSGANNPLWYIENNELKEIKANKQPIGKTDYPTSFTTHILELKESITFYLLTDGYPDQFGGNKGKKFKHKQLKDLLLANSHKPLDLQKNILAQSFEA